MKTIVKHREITAEEFAKAERRYEEMLASQPLATEVRYSRSDDMIVIRLDTGAILSIPRRMMQGLESASPEQLDGFDIGGHGSLLSWPELDADFKITLLLEGIYGSTRWMAELGRKGGQVRSPAKAKAARENGKRGGRPRKRTSEVKR